MVVYVIWPLLATALAGAQSGVQGCRAATINGADLVVFCPDGVVLTVTEWRFHGTFESSDTLAAMSAAWPRKPTLRPDGLYDVEVAGTPTVLGVTEARPGVARLVSIAAPLQEHPEHARGDLFAATLAHGPPGLEDIFEPWPDPVFRGTDVTVPAGCFPTKNGAGLRVACGLDNITLVVEIDTTVAASNRAGEQGAWAIAAKRDLTMEMKRLPCKVFGRRATCRFDLVANGSPLEIPYTLVGAVRRGRDVEVAMCSWSGNAATLPTVCAQSIRVDLASPGKAIPRP